LSKEYNSVAVCCSEGIRVNRSLAVMGVKYLDREEPKKPEKRSKVASGKDPVAKKRKVSSTAAESSKVAPKVPSARPPRPPPKVPSAKKGNRLARYLRGVSHSELSSKSFMRDLEETISYSPLRGEPMELYLDQFGSLLSGPYSVGDVVVKLQQSGGTGGRSISLLDLEDEGATIDPIMIVTTAGSTPELAKVVAKITSAASAASSIQPSKVLECVEGEKTKAVTAAVREDSVGAAEALMGDDTRDDGQHRFEELDGFYYHVPLIFKVRILILISLGCVK
jgi:hypothetical protein